MDVTPLSDGSPSGVLESCFAVADEISVKSALYGRHSCARRHAVRVCWKAASQSLTRSVQIDTDRRVRCIITINDMAAAKILYFEGRA